MNSLNLKQIDGGNIIKQADSGSLFKFELLDENHKKFEEQLGDTATVILKKDTVAVFKKIVTVVDNCVAFNLDKILEVGDYILEIIVGSYVFPSNNRLKISVESTYGDYQPENLVRITYEEIDEKINELKDRLDDLNVAGQTEIMNRIVALEQKEDMDTVYDDTELVNRVTALENKTDKDTIYDDAQLKEEISETKSKVDSLSEKISSLESKQDNDTIYDDSEIKRRITALEQKQDHDTVYDDTEIKQSVADVDTKVDNLSEKVTALEKRPIVDTALTERVEALEQKEDKDTVYDDTEIKKELSELNQSIAKKKLYYAYADEKDGVKGFTKADVYDSFYREIFNYFGISEKDSDNADDYFWMPARAVSDDELSRILSEVDKLKELHEVRRAPTGYALDRTTTPWTIWFDNGCGLQMPEYGTTATVYGYGFSASFTDNNITIYPIIPNIIRVSNGSLTIEKIKTIKGGADFWSPSIKIINPIRDRNDYDWINARFNPEALSNSSYQYVRQQYFIRTMYELGIWSESDVEGFGATKK